MLAAAERFIYRAILVVVALALINAAYGPVGMVAGGFAGLIGWAYSLKVKEWQACPSCGGGSKHHGLFAKRSFSLCDRCSGTNGRVVRWGVRFLRPARARELLAGTGREAVWRG